MFRLPSVGLVASLLFVASVFGQDTRGAARAETPRETAGRLAADAASHGVSVALLTELAHSHEQDGDPARALATLELARWYDPRNAGVGAEISRLRTALGVADEADGWRAPFHCLTIQEWSFVLLGAALALGGLALARGLRRTTAPRAAWRKVVAASLVLMIAASVTGLALQSRRMDEAIVHVSDGRVLLSPTSAAQAVGSVHAGERVTIEGTHRSFLLVRSRAGLTGWLPEVAVTSMTGLPPAPSAAPNPERSGP